MTADSDVALERRGRRERVVLEHMETENRQEFDRTIRTFSHPRYELVATGQVIDGPTDVAAYYVRGRSVIPDQRNELIAMHHSDDSVIIEFWLRGTQLGGPNPTGRPFKCQMCAIFTFDDDDLMTNERVYFDQLTILNQVQGTAASPDDAEG
jgi:hypothetical protein